MKDKIKEKYHELNILGIIYIDIDHRYHYRLGSIVNDTDYYTVASGYSIWKSKIEIVYIYNIFALKS